MLYRFNGFYSINICCDVKVYRNVVVVSQSSINGGTPITNRSEYLATQIAREFKIKLHKLIFFECYEDLGYYTKVTYDISANGFCNPSWKRVTKKYINECIEEEQNHIGFSLLTMLKRK